MGLEDYKELVATSAMICTMGHMLSGTLVCRSICKKGTSDEFDAKPFVGGIGMGIVMLQYAFILKDSVMITVNIFGFITSIAYIAVFYAYAVNKNKILGLVGKTIGTAAIFLAYANFEHPDNVEFRFGLLTTVLLFLLISSPLMNLGQVIRTKSTDVLPFPLIAMGTVVSSQWLLYGIIVNNTFIIFQNAVGFMLHIAQLSLFVIFPSKPAAITSKANARKKD
ncbi:hypothetical protein PV325_005154 [Microctonus aethiopoides]|nr:hypothetical protein PV325_005154 [Microctonus aethiopoides]KAK0099085.1 hypothetical protein PV326_006549 [Microctonus aethiopoides]